MYRFLEKIIILTGLNFFLFYYPISVIANEDTTTYHEAIKEDFKPGEFIMEHIGDSYEWHIANIGHFHLSIPLLVILYSEHSGLNLFCASKFHHGQSSYKNFRISHEGQYKGKIVEMVNGVEYRPWDFSITKNVLSLFFSIILLLVIF
ncbi:MAG: F0F1 ATP synthase subunit A, partial [Bacteroidia bacterium]|nr:F0F1 ATP synthase subunit A [Bacteroidia bacterium]